MNLPASFYHWVSWSAEDESSGSNYRALRFTGYGKKPLVLYVEDGEGGCPHVHGFSSIVRSRSSVRLECSACGGGDQNLSVTARGGPMQRYVKQSEEHWTRKGISFMVREYDMSALKESDKQALADFCDRSNLRNNALAMLDDSGPNRLLLVTREDTREIVGFCVYDMYVHTPPDPNRMQVDEFLKRMNAQWKDDLGRAFEENRWLPGDEDKKDEWLSLTQEMVEYCVSRRREDASTGGTRDSQREYAMETELRDYLNDTIRNSTSTDDGMITDERGPIVNYLYDLAVELSPQEEDANFKKEITAISYVHLICADEELKGYGISKGVFRLIQYRVTMYGSSKGVDTAKIKLEYANSKVRAIYLAYGFVPMAGTYLITRDLFQFPNSLDIREDESKEEESNDKKRKKKVRGLITP
jgi:hypothetical protein